MSDTNIKKECKMPAKSKTPQFSKSPVPLPPDLLNLPCIEAEPWVQVDAAPQFVEGPAFDRKGNLFVTLPAAGSVIKITPRKVKTTVFHDSHVHVTGSAFHKDGRLFIVCMSSELLVLDPDGKELARLYPKYKGKKMPMNDLVFDPQGRIYMTHFIGDVMKPTGGVFRISTDAKIVEPVVSEGLALPNGISLSPEGNSLWVGEVTRNRILLIRLLKDGVTFLEMK